MENQEKEIDMLCKVFDELKKLKWGDEKIIECPKCGGKLHIGKSSYNGHFHIYCENKDFCVIQ